MAKISYGGQVVAAGRRATGCRCLSKGQVVFGELRGTDQCLDKGRSLRIEGEELARCEAAGQDGGQQGDLRERSYGKHGFVRRLVIAIATTVTVVVAWQKWLDSPCDRPSF